jgi:hypothetical protein
MCILTLDMVQDIYHNLSLGPVTKIMACKGEGQEGRLGVTSHVLESARECEGMNLHTLPSEFPFWKLESRWTPESLESKGLHKCTTSSCK